MRNILPHLDRHMLSRVASPLVLSFLCFAVLWKGGKSLESTWLLLGVAAIVLLLQNRQHTAHDPLPRWLWATGMAFVLWTILSLCTSSTANYGLDEVLRTAALVTVFFWTARHTVATGILFAERLTRVLAPLSIVSMIMGAAVYILQPVNRFVGTFFDARFQTDYWPNAWGDFVLLSWPLLLWWALRTPRHARKEYLLRSLVIGALLGTLFLSYSRGSILAAAGQVALLPVLCLTAAVIQGSRTSWLRRIAPLFLIIPITAWITFTTVNEMRSAFFPVQSALEKARFEAAEGTSSIDERRDFWQQSWQLSLERPLTGWGPYSFRFVQPRLQQSVFATSDHAHNVVLKLAMERGWPAAALFVLLVLGTVWIPLQPSRLRKTLDSEMGSLLPFVLTAVAGTLAHSLIDYNLQFVANGLLLWVQLGLIAGMGTFDVPSRALPSLRPRQTIEAMVLMVLLLFAFVEGVFLITSSLGRHAEVSGNTSEALTWYARSEYEYFSRDMLLSRAHLLMQTGDLPAAENAVRAYLERNAHDARAWLLLGEVLTQRGDHAQAFAAYSTARQRGEWNHLDAVRGFLDTAIAIGATDTVLAETAAIELLMRSYADAIMHNIHFVALTPNVEALSAVAERMASLVPAEAAVYRRWAADAAAHAAVERARLQSRTPGMLW